MRYDGADMTSYHALYRAHEWKTRSVIVRQVLVLNKHARDNLITVVSIFAWKNYGSKIEYGSSKDMIKI